MYVVMHEPCAPWRRPLACPRAERGVRGAEPYAMAHAEPRAASASRFQCAYRTRGISMAVAYLFAL